MPDGTEEQRGLSVAILSYFMEHPAAVDNPEGVSGWRLLSSRVRSTVESTQRVLDSLVQQGYLRKIETRSGPLYQINADNREAAERFLGQTPNLAMRDHRKSISREETVEIRIKNLGKQLLLVPLSSRATLHLAPGQTSEPVHETEISRNEKVAKLVNSGWIKVIRMTA